MRNKTEEDQLSISVSWYDIAIIKIITPKQ